MSNKENSLDIAVKEIQKKYGDSIIRRGNENFGVKKIRTGSPYLDWALEGGIPRGRTIEMYGNPSAGKSLLSLQTTATAQEAGLDCVYMDAEMSFDPDFAAKHGVNLDSLLVVQEQEGDNLWNMLIKLIEGGADLIVVDSIASIVPTYEAENDMEKQTVGLHARMMSKGLRKITGLLRENNCTVLFLNQIREKIGSYGNPEITTGGRALGFYASVRIQVRRGEFYVENKEKVGQEIRFKIQKSKTSMPFREGYLKYYYETGFDKIDEMVSMLIVNEYVTRKGSYYYLNGEEEGYRGRQALEKAIREDDSLQKKLMKEVLDK